MELIHVDRDIVVCIKPPRVLSTDEPGGLPDLVRQALGDANANIRTVHRLDRVVSGVMVLARNAKAASELSRQIREDEFEKEYLAVIHGVPAQKKGTLRDLLGRDKARKMTYVAEAPGKGIQEAILDYEVLSEKGEFSLVRVTSPQTYNGAITLVNRTNTPTTFTHFSVGERGFLVHPTLYFFR